MRAHTAAAVVVLFATDLGCTFAGNMFDYAYLHTAAAVLETFDACSYSAQQQP